MNGLLCWISLHKWRHSSTFLPNIYAKIVTDFISHTECKHCMKVKNHTHVVWNGKDMVDK